jgi:hypothetical protein
LNVRVRVYAIYRLPPAIKSIITRRVRNNFEEHTVLVETTYMIFIPYARARAGRTKAIKKRCNNNDDKNRKSNLRATATVRTPRSQCARAILRFSSGGGINGINYKAGNGFRQITIARPVRARP